MKFVREVFLLFLLLRRSVSILLSCALQKFPSVAFGGLRLSAELAGRLVGPEPKQITEEFQRWVY